MYALAQNIATFTKGGITIQNSDFVSASSYVRTLEKRLLTTAGIERAADAPGSAEAFRLLSQNSDYNFGSLARSEDYEAALKSELVRVYKLIYGVTAHRQVVDAAACKYDYHNVKAALKERYHKGRTPPPYMRVTDVAPETIEKELEAGIRPAMKSDLPEHIVRALVDAKEAFERTQNPQSIDISADKSMFAHMLELCGEIGSELITEHVRAQIDFHNVKTLLRAKNMQKGSAFLAECLVSGGGTDTSYFAASYNKTPAAMVPAFFYKSFGSVMKKGVEEYEKSGNFAVLERMFDNCLIDMTRQAKYITYGPEILYAYLLSKENEIRQVRMLVTAKQNGLRAELLRERLRENYA